MRGVDALIEACADRLAREQLAFGHGGADPRSEAELLVLGFLENHPLDANTRDALEELLERRIVQRVPCAYLTGEAWFADRWFAVRPGVMIPRSPIQELILCDFRPWLRRAPGTVLDICCGTGCIGLATALQFPQARVMLADIDAVAVANARANIERFDLVRPRRSATVRSFRRARSRAVRLGARQSALRPAHRVPGAAAGIRSRARARAGGRRRWPRLLAATAGGGRPMAGRRRDARRRGGQYGIGSRCCVSPSAICLAGDGPGGTAV